MNITDRRDAILQARNILAAAPVIFDTETTGLDSDAEIIEISCITAHGSVLLDTLVKPTTSVPEGRNQDSWTRRRGPGGSAHHPGTGTPD